MLIMLNIAPRKKRIMLGFTSAFSMASSTTRRSSFELTLLEGRVSQTRKEPEESVMRTSHSFFPPTRTGRE